MIFGRPSSCYEARQWCEERGTELGDCYAAELPAPVAFVCKAATGWKAQTGWEEIAKAACSATGGYWWNGQCQVKPAPGTEEPPPVGPTDQPALPEPATQKYAATGAPPTWLLPAAVVGLAVAVFLIIPR